MAWLDRIWPRTSRGPRLFGLGMSRTGTSSLERALQILGIACAHYEPDRGVISYMEGRSPQLQLREWMAYQAIVDLPVPFLLRELDALFPGSKFILTTRPLESWQASCARHFRRRLVNRRLYRLRSSDWEHWDHAVTRFVFRQEEYDAEVFRRIFLESNARVLDWFKDRPQDLLVMDQNGGFEWPRLCAFLGCPVPDVPFPRVNQFAFSRYWSQGPRYRHAVRACYAAGASSQALVTEGAPSARLLGVERAGPLMECALFEAPRPETALARVAQVFYPEEPLEAAAARLAREGWLVEESAWAPAVPEQNLPPLDRLAVPTSGRGPAALDVVREAWLASPPETRPRAWIANLDGDESAAALHAASARAVREGLHVSWTGLEECRKFIGRAPAGFSRRALEFLLFGQPGEPYRCGALRNVLLLSQAGSRFVLQDDDVRLPLTDVMKDDDPILSARVDSLRLVRVFASAKQAAEAGLPCPGSGLELHDALLGRAPGSVARPGAAFRPEWGNAEPSVLGRIRHPACRIRLTFLGLRGDAGSHDGSLRWSSHPLNAPLWLENEEAYQASRGSRSVLLAHPEHRLGLHPFHATHMGIDATASLPPFLPAFRGSDVLMCMMLAEHDPDSVYGYLPWCAHHQPVEARSGYPPLDPDAPGVREIPLHAILVRILRAEGRGAAPAFRREASLPAASLRESLTYHLRQAALDGLALLDRVEAEARLCPSAQADARIIRQRNRALFEQAHILWPREIATAPIPLELWRDFLSRWADALELWPALWEAVRADPEWQACLSANPAEEAR